MQRCNNCGWMNNEPRVRCEKCNYPLEGSLNINQAGAPPANESNDFTNSLDKTISGKPSVHSAWDGPNTGEISGDISSDNYSDNFKKTPPIAELTDNNDNGQKVEISSPIAQKPIVNSFDKTIDPSRIPKLTTSFKLKPILREREKEEKEITFSEDFVELSRENTDPDNMSITSKTQAIIEFIDGAWFLLDKSKLKTTFKQVDEPVALKAGDIILLGDRKFVFDV